MNQGILLRKPKKGTRALRQRSFVRHFLPLSEAIFVNCTERRDAYGTSNEIAAIRDATLHVFIHTYDTLQSDGFVQRALRAGSTFRMFSLTIHPSIRYTCVNIDLVCMQ